MRVAVLCPGPSLAGFANRGGYELRIAVNRAAGLYACDYWAALDEHSFDITVPIGRPRIICDRSNYLKLCQRKPEAAEHGNYSVEDLADQLPHKHVKWHTWSMTAAIAAARVLGATEVHVWGADWKGQNDFDGYLDSVQNRGDERWVRERKLYFELAAWMDGMGTRVTRVLQQEGT